MNTAQRAGDRVATTRTERTVRRRRTADGSDRWEDLINAAVDLFYEKGYTATSLQDLGDAVGLLKGSLYHYIDTKEDLLYEIMRRALELRANTVVEDPDLLSADAETRLRAFIRRWMSSSQHAGKLSVVAEMEFRKLSPRRLRAVIAQRDKYAEFVKTLVESGVQEGVFDEWTNATFATNSIFVIMRNIPIWYQPAGQRSFEDVVDWHVEFIVRGLRRHVDP